MAANPTEKMSSHPHLQTFLAHGEITYSFSLSYPSPLLPRSLLLCAILLRRPVHVHISSNLNGQGTKADKACEGKEPTSWCRILWTALCGQRVDALSISNQSVDWERGESDLGDLEKVCPPLTRDILYHFLKLQTLTAWTLTGTTHFECLIQILFSAFAWSV